MTAGASKSPNNVTDTFFNTVHLLPKDLRLERGGAKVACCPRRQLTSLRPWLHLYFSILTKNGSVSQVTCSYISSPDLKGKELLRALYEAISVFHNTSGQVECYNISSSDLQGLSTA